MKTIYKYPLKAEDYQMITMPRGAQILTVLAQKESPCIWALVDTGNETEERYFRMAGTGHRMGPEEKFLRYIGTFQIMRDNLVFHVFEVEGR